MKERSNSSYIWIIVEPSFYVPAAILYNPKNLTAHYCKKICEEFFIAVAYLNFSIICELLYSVIILSL